MIFFSSDQHIGHSSILKLCDRPFNFINEHDNEIVRRHNEVVSNDDTIYDLGDLGFRCSPQYLSSVLRRMNGKRIVILGNHDKPFRQAHRKGLLNDLIESDKLEVIGGNEAINDSTLSTYKMLTIEGQKIFIGHYALRTWPNAFRGSWHAYGHSHGNLPEPFYRSFDVGVDKHNFYPWSFEEIKARMLKIDSDFKEN